jgi:hypothetical protein
VPAGYAATAKSYQAGTWRQTLPATTQGDR